MLVGRIVMETTDVRRVTVDFSQWLDAGETLSTIASPKVALDGGAWGTGPTPQPGVVVYDPTPLTLQSIALINTSTEVQLFVANGTPGNAYVVSFVVWGSSGRHLTIEIKVQLRGTTVVPQSTSSAGLTGFLPLAGGTMLGPLYLEEDPQTSMEAVTKEYSDNLFLTLNGDTTNEATARAAADLAITNSLTAEVARAEAAEAALNVTHTLVAGSGLGGGTITLSGTIASADTLNADWNGGSVSALGGGLALNGTTLDPAWNGGSVSALGTGLSRSGSTLWPQWNGGSVGALGAGMSLSSGTLNSQWGGGSVGALGTGMSLSSGTLNSTGGTVVKVVGGNGLSGGTITASGTLDAQWNAGTVTAIGGGLSISGTTLDAPTPEWTAGTVRSIGTGLTLAAGVLSALPAGAASIQTGTVAATTSWTAVAFDETLDSIVAILIFGADPGAPIQASNNSAVYSGNMACYALRNVTTSGFQITSPGGSGSPAPGAATPGTVSWLAIG